MVLWSRRYINHHVSCVRHSPTFAVAPWSHFQSPTTKHRSQCRRASFSRAIQRQVDMAACAIRPPSCSLNLPHIRPSRLSLSQGHISTMLLVINVYFLCKHAADPPMAHSTPSLDPSDTLMVGVSGRCIGFLPNCQGLCDCASVNAPLPRHCKSLDVWRDD